MLKVTVALQNDFFFFSVFFENKRHQFKTIINLINNNIKYKVIFFQIFF